MAQRHQTSGDTYRYGSSWSDPARVSRGRPTNAFQHGALGRGGVRAGPDKSLGRSGRTLSSPEPTNLGANRIAGNWHRVASAQGPIMFYYVK